MPKFGRSPRRCSRPAASTAALAIGALLLATPSAAAQALFDGPAPPAAAPAGVRGVMDPNLAPTGPVGMAGAPPAAFASSAGSGVLPPAGFTSVPAGAAQSPVTEATPIEGTEIIARVDGQVILASDVLWQVRQLIKMTVAKNPNAVPPGQEANVEKMLMRQLVMGLIDTKLLYNDFRRTVPAENLPKVEESLAKPFEESEVPRLMKMLALKNRAELETALLRSGTSIRDVQRQFNEKTIAGEWLRQRVPKPDPVTYETLLAYYQDHLKEYEFDAQVRWEEIMVRFDRCGDRDVAWRQLCELGNQVWQAAVADPNMRGAAFTGVAKAHSHGVTASGGGQYDWTTLGALKCEAINNALSSLQIGQMSDGIESDQGFHIVRVLERKEAGRVPFTEAQADIRKLLENEQKTALLQAELAELRRSAKAWTLFDGDLNGPQLSELLDENNKRR